MGSCCVTQGAQLSALWWPRGVHEGGGGREAREGRHLCIAIADSHCRTTATNTHWKAIILQLKIKKKKTRCWYCRIVLPHQKTSHTVAESWSLLTNVWHHPSCWFLQNDGVLCGILGLPWWLRRLSVCLQCGRPGFDPWVGKIPGRGNGNPLQYSCLENPFDGGAWQAIVDRGRRESDTTEQLHFSV